MLQNLHKCKKLSNFNVISQVLNFNTKVIGVMVSTVNKTNGIKPTIIPCRPSALYETLPFILADDHDILNTFQDTLYVLQNHSSKNCNIPCKPIMKIINNNIIVGIVTETNQFVPVIPEPHTSSPVNEDGQDENGLLIVNNPFSS